MPNTFTIQHLKWVGKDNGGLGGNPDIFDDPNVKEANSQSFTPGDIVYISSGAVTAWSDHATTAIGGIALEAATNVTTGNKAIKFMKIHSDDVFEATVYHSTEASAVTAVAEIGTQYGLVEPTAGAGWCVNVEDTTGPRVKIVGFKYGPATDKDGNPCQMAIGDIYGRAYIKFSTSAADGTNLLQFN